MTQEEFEQQIADLDAFVRDLYETVATMNQQIHSLAHKLIEVEARVDNPAPTPFKFPR